MAEAIEDVLRRRAAEQEAAGRAAADEYTMQEFYCSECPADQGGSERGGYFLVKLNRNYNSKVTIVCPQCKHEHSRCVTAGHITEVGRDDKAVRETIRPRLASWSRRPRTSLFAGRAGYNAKRDGATITKEEDVVPRPEEGADDGVEHIRQQFLRQSWLDYHGDKLT